MSELIIIRGCPGSGKTTRAREIVRDEKADCMYAADDLFMKSGNYVFVPKKIGKAHQQCQERTFSALRQGKNVVVHNTFSCRWEMEPYLQFCKEEGYELQVIDLFASNNLTADELHERTKTSGNGHNVPQEVIQAMLDRYEKDWENGNPLPPWLRKKQKSKTR